MGGAGTPAVHEEFRQRRADLGHLLAKLKDFSCGQTAVGDRCVNAYILSLTPKVSRPGLMA